MRSHLLKMAVGEDSIIETPQLMYMRVATSMWMPDMEKIKETYEQLSQHLYTHASPVYYNSGLVNNQLASCFLLTIAEDSVEGIYDVLKQCAVLSKHAGGVGLDVCNVRAQGSRIHGNNGAASGIVPMLKVT